MSQSNHIPTISQLDNTWLTEQLRAAGHSDATVTSFQRQAIGTGQMANCFRLSLEIESDDPTVPRSLIAKVTSDSEESRKMGSTLPVYRREVEFYQKFQPLLTISTPRSYFSEIADDNVNFMILLEDMSPADQGDQLVGCGPEVARKGIRELVGLHAPTWNKPELLDADSNLKPICTPLSYYRDAYISCVEAFISRHGHTFSAAQIDIMRKLAVYEEPLFKLDTNLYSLVHMDYRLDNILLTPDSNNPDMTVVDWQSYDVGNPLNDVAYFIGSSLAPEVRREVEEDIVRDYYNRICDAGVKNLSWDDCWRAYRKGSLHGFVITLVAGVSVEQTERGDKMFRLLADRYSQHALDLKADELFR